MQKHISLAENAPTAHIFNYLTIDINSQDPYLLGFDSNLIPNFSYYFSRILERIPSIRKNPGDSHVFQRLLLGIPRIFGKFIRLVLSLYRIQQCSLQIPNTSIICWIRKE